MYVRKNNCELLNIPAEKQFGAEIALGYLTNNTILSKKEKHLKTSYDLYKS
jgi:hypothetical protein